MTIAQSLRQEGLQEGIQQGMQHGQTVMKFTGLTEKDLSQLFVS